MGRPSRERVNGRQTDANVGVGRPSICDGKRRSLAHLRRDDRRRGILLGIRLVWPTRERVSGGQAGADLGVGRLILRNGKRRRSIHVWSDDGE